MTALGLWRSTVVCLFFGGVIPYFIALVIAALVLVGMVIGVLS